MLMAVSLRAFASGKPSLRMNLAKSSVKLESPLRVRRGRAWKCNTPTIISGKPTPTDGVDGPNGISVPQYGS
jgi:hypothetical protein